eukprot:SM000021S06465  [mRNA]  locus=s21:506858:508728:+ [translate_table: standard]
MGDGSLAGLRTGRELREEAEEKARQNAARFAQLDSSATGRGAQTVYRDKRGRKLDSLEELMRIQEGQKAKEPEPLVWGKGLAQQRQAAREQEEMESAANEPFATYRDDPKLDKMLKERIRFGDPMAHLVKSKGAEELLEDMSKDEAMLQSGFAVPQDIPPHSWLKRKVGAPANRFAIRPGRHWDGVDRSNGFEREMFKAKNERAALQQEAYSWSVADM